MIEAIRRYAELVDAIERMKTENTAQQMRMQRFAQGEAKITSEKSAEM